jgi:hypothetical protein
MKTQTENLKSFLEEQTNSKQKTEAISELDKLIVYIEQLEALIESYNPKIKDCFSCKNYDQLTTFGSPCTGCNSEEDKPYKNHVSKYPFKSLYDKEKVIISNNKDRFEGIINAIKNTESKTIIIVDNPRTDRDQINSLLKDLSNSIIKEMPINKIDMKPLISEIPESFKEGKPKISKHQKRHAKKSKW